MRRAAVTTAAATIVVLGAPTAALAACGDYSGTCETPASVLPTTLDRGSVTPVDRAGVGATMLPFTGGELVLIGLAAMGALGTGTALVLGGRRTLPEVPSR